MDNQGHDPQPPVPQPTPPPVQPAQPEPATLTKAEKLKRLFFQILIGCLIGAAAVAVVAVLVGKFNSTLARALGTLAMVAIHAIFGFGYITQSEQQNKKDGGRSIDLFSNVVFTLIVVSFITSVFAIWEILSGNLTLKLYMFYGVLLFADLHADVLYRIRRFDKKIDNIVTANYVFMTIVVIMLTTLIFTSERSSLGAFFYRLLAAVAIVDATMTLTAAIMHKMFLQKHPQMAAQAAKTDSLQTKKFWQHPLMILLLIYLAFQVIATLIFSVRHP